MNENLSMKKGDWVLALEDADFGGVWLTKKCIYEILDADELLHYSTIRLNLKGNVRYVHYRRVQLLDQRCFNNKEEQ